MNDEIHILGLELPARVGVPDAERAAWQTLSTDICLGLVRGFDTMGDDIADTLDYQVAAEQATALAAARPRRLIETLAWDLVASFLADPRVSFVEVTLRKRILPHTDAVAVRLRREKPAGGVETGG